MFDYKRGYASDLETSGIMDIFRLPKFAYYFYQSQLDANQGYPMLSIANYWNDSNQKTVKIYSNCQQVELFLNGTSLGVQKPDTDAFSRNLSHAPFTFDPNAYIPGTLTAVGYIGGKKIITDTVTTPGNAFKLVIKADLSGRNLMPGKNDMIFAYACVTDKNGIIVPGAINEIKFSAEGNGSIIGPAEAGIAPVLLKAGDKPRNIKLTASAVGLKSGELIYTTK
jgi:beta-galactosidase